MKDRNMIRASTHDALDDGTPEGPALTKAVLSELVGAQASLNRRDAKEMVDAFFEMVAGRLIEGHDVKLSGFGNFQIRTKAPRPGRNPRTGELIPIDARRVVIFHASHKLKDQVQSTLDGTDSPEE
jgi:integration host factor subunit alpha